MSIIFLMHAREALRQPGLLDRLLLCTGQSASSLAQKRACAQVSGAYAAALDGKSLGENVVRRLAADIEMQLNALRNAAYAKGVTAARSQFAQFAEAPFRCLCS